MPHQFYTHPQEGMNMQKTVYEAIEELREAQRVLVDKALFRASLLLDTVIDDIKEETLPTDIWSDE